MHFNWTTFIIIPLVLLFFSGCQKEKKKEALNTKPNIVFILTDDQGWGDLSISGNTNLSTPNIDAIGNEGVVFDRFYVSPVCSPTRAEILTGRYHARSGVYDTSEGGERIDLDETTIADIFKKAGYQTAAYGKWHNGMQPPYHPNARGFDDFYGFCSGHWGNYFSPILEHNGEIVTGNGFLVDDLTDHGIQFIEENKDKPFFLYLPFNTPHGPMQVPDRWWKKYENKELKMRHRDPEMEDLPFTRAALAMCENIDWNVGRITDKLKELDLTDNTIVIYLSDNGPNSWRWNDGMKGKKGSTDEGGVRSPLLIKWPGNIPSGKKINEIAGAIDFLPTLTDLAGIEPEVAKPLDGISLKPLMMENDPSWEDRLIFSHWGKGNRVSVRNANYRLDDQNKLFDMKQDPGQKNDISNEFPEIARELVQGKEKWIREVLSELPETDDRTFPIGHPDYTFTQIPARDGTAHGNIVRSNRWPNCSFYTQWTSIEDKITWDAEVLADGEFEVRLWYTCPAEDVGSTFELSFNDAQLTGKITEAHDPPLTGMENDRVERHNSYVKDFKPLNLGTIRLTKGMGTLTLKALEIPGSQVMDFRLLMLKRL